MTDATITAGALRARMTSFLGSDDSPARVAVRRTRKMLVRGQLDDLAMPTVMSLMDRRDLLPRFLDWLTEQEHLAGIPPDFCPCCGAKRGEVSAKLNVEGMSERIRTALDSARKAIEADLQKRNRSPT